MESGPAWPTPPKARAGAPNVLIFVLDDDMPHTVPIMYGTEGLTCGRDGGSTVAPDAYAGDFAFTGTLHRVTMDISGTDLIADSQ